MKKYSKKYNKLKLIKELAEHFTEEFEKIHQIIVLPNNDVVYKDYIIKKMSNENYGIYHKLSKDLVGQFFHRACAVMAAKAYNNSMLTRYNEIKQLDNRYWANRCDNLVYRKNIKTAKEFERYLVLLNKLEDSDRKTEHYKEEISRMFKWSFV